MTDASWDLISTINTFNGDSKDSLKAAYSFDAGPNCCIFVEKPNLMPLIACLARRYGFGDKLTEKNFFRNFTDDRIDKSIINELDHNSLNGVPPSFKDSIQYVIVSEIGCGPKVLPN